jgi:hypothetical protein
MFKVYAWRAFAAAAFVVLAISPQAFAACSGPIAVQVLGSGGPDSNDARASSGYLLWLDGEARLLVDAGGGVFLRFGEAKAKFESPSPICTQITSPTFRHCSKAGFSVTGNGRCRSSAPAAEMNFPASRNSCTHCSTRTGERFGICQAISTAAEGWFAPISSKWTQKLERQKLHSETIGSN